MRDKNRVIGNWLLIGVGMLIIQVALGGITRLTGSGLSITEWKPILGTLPPFNDVDWNQAFDLYKQKTGQFKYLNQDFTLSDFKFIYFWEWLHRNWARLISVVFMIPFIYFLVKGYFTKSMVPKLLGLFALGLGQGLIGWIMVASGLNDDNLYVSHIKLALHFISALILICFTYWFALSLLVKPEDRIEDSKLKTWNWILIGILGVQLIYGAFMAGLKAATTAPTWPTINGDYLPSSIFSENMFHHPISVHFIHRNLGYFLFVLLFVVFLKMRRIHKSDLFKKFYVMPLILAIFQVILGILSVLTSSKLTRNGFGTFEFFAQLHQLVAMFLLMSLIWVVFMFSEEKNQKSNGGL
jgi:cytochrome c oxidase assembly protein subunit 15